MLWGKTERKRGSRRGRRGGASGGEGQVVGQRAGQRAGRVAVKGWGVPLRAPKGNPEGHLCLWGQQQLDSDFDSLLRGDLGALFSQERRWGHRLQRRAHRSARIIGLRVRKDALLRS